MRCSQMSKRIVCLDAGHGGKDPGAVGNGLREKDLTLYIALKAGQMLERHGVQVVYTRKTDKFLELYERAKIANDAGAEVFASVHINAAVNTAARGVETFQHTMNSKWKSLARDIQSRIMHNKVFLPQYDRGVKKANFAVLRLTNMEAALVEFGFITNYNDATMLGSIGGGLKEEMAYSLAEGILVYLGIPIKDLDYKPLPPVEEVKPPIKPPVEEVKPMPELPGKKILKELVEYQNSQQVFDYAKESVKKAVTSGVFSDGDGDGQLDNPKEFVTREQMAVILDRLGLLEKK